MTLFFFISSRQFIEGIVQFIDYSHPIQMDFNVMKGWKGKKNLTQGVTLGYKLYSLEDLFHLHSKNETLFPYSRQFMSVVFIVIKVNLVPGMPVTV